MRVLLLYMDNGNSTENNTFAKKSELVLKLATAVLGVLYVLGVLVSNMHLMTLGISDFTSLQARNIMTGFLFIFYTFLLLLTMTPVSIAIYVCGRTVISSKFRLLGKIARFVGTIIAALLILMFILPFVGIIFGFVYPWGRPWEAGFTRTAWTWRGMVSDSQIGYVQFTEAFWHLHIIVASCLITIGLLPYISLIWRYFDSDQEDRTKRGPLIAVFQPSLKLVAIYPLLALPLLLVGFAQYTYPNIPINLGGGQPDIVELQIVTDEPASITLPGIGTTHISVQGKETMITDPVVIWYQSDKFLYLAPLTTQNQSSTRLVALDITLVRTIRYLSKSVRVAPGGRILSIHSD